MQLRWKTRHLVVSLTNHDNCYYRLQIGADWVNLPCQHLPTLIACLENYNKNYPITFTFEPYSLAHADHIRTIEIPPGTAWRVLELFRNAQKTWNPAWTSPPPFEGIYR